MYNLFFNKYGAYADVVYYTYIILYDQCTDLSNKRHKTEYIQNQILTIFKFLSNLPKNLSELKDENGNIKSWCGATEVT